LLINFTKSHVFTVLPTADQMNWSQLELNAVSNACPHVNVEASTHLSGKRVYQDLEKRRGGELSRWTQNQQPEL
jgi:hypothetical protein